MKKGAAAPLNESSQRLYINVNDILGTGSAGGGSTLPPQHPVESSQQAVVACGKCDFFPFLRMSSAKRWPGAFILCLRSTGFLNSPPSTAQDLWGSQQPQPFFFQPLIKGQTAATLALRDVAQAITVKVLAGDNSGSGTILRRDGVTHVVITNAHVLTTARGGRVEIRTMVGRTYPARLMPRSSGKPADLALLEFTSTLPYAPAILNLTPDLPVGTPVHAAGYPFQANPSSRSGFVVASSHIALIPKRMFTGGYQVGYTNMVEKGMSGGPVLSVDGQVVAINGMHAFPIWGNPYVYDDGSKPNPDQ